jgi:hypothetical protein
MFPLNLGIPEQDESWAPSSTTCSIKIGQSRITTVQNSTQSDTVKCWLNFLKKKDTIDYEISGEKFESKQYTSKTRFDMHNGNC